MGQIIIFALTARRAGNLNVRAKNSIYASLHYEISNMCEDAFVCTNRIIIDWYVAEICACARIPLNASPAHRICINSVYYTVL